MSDLLFNLCDLVTQSGLEEFLKLCPSEGPRINRDKLKYVNTSVLRLDIRLDSEKVENISSLLFLPYYFDNLTGQQTKIEHGVFPVNLSYNFDDNKMCPKVLKNLNELRSKIRTNLVLPNTVIPIYRISSDKYLILDGNRRMIAIKEYLRDKPLEIINISFLILFAPISGTILPDLRFFE